MIENSWMMCKFQDNIFLVVLESWGLGSLPQIPVVAPGFAYTILMVEIVFPGIPVITILP